MYRQAVSADYGNGWKANSGVYTDAGTTLATNGQTVEQWNDLSGNNDNYSQSNSSQRPTYVSAGINGWPTIHEAASSQQVLKSTINLSSSNFTILYVAKMDGPTEARILSAISNNWLLGWWNGSMAQAYFNGWVTGAGGNSTDNKAHEYTGMLNGTTATVWDNGSQVASQSGGFTGPSGLGTNAYAASSEFSDADVAEIIAYNSALTTANRQSIENYLDNKYGLAGRTDTVSSSVQYNGSNTAKVVAGSNNAQLVQAVNVGNTNNYLLSAYAYINGSTAVNSSYAQLYVNGSRRINHLYLSRRWLV